VVWTSAGSAVVKILTISIREDKLYNYCYKSDVSMLIFAIADMASDFTLGSSDCNCYSKFYEESTGDYAVRHVYGAVYCFFINLRLGSINNLLL
jgi:hypothetical protein